MASVAKRDPAEGYPPEEGCYLRGNDYSPVAVAVILRWMREQTPPDIERLVRAAIERGAALAGTLQTENVGLEKVICNVVANPNIRYMVVCGPESPGHLVGDAILALVKNGLDGRKRIVGAQAPTPYLFNVPASFVERFRKQVTIIDLINEGDPEEIRRAVWSCYQEQPTDFCGHALFDPGAFPEPPLSGRITWRVTHPEREPKTDDERERRAKLQSLMDRVRKSVEGRSKAQRMEDAPMSSPPPARDSMDS
jgi:tetrahydromethanopterin S-methyltransferase subunit A